ncbi:MAG: NADH-quinone oxidoreductase subunit J [Verrucomicrobiota bacterium]
MSEFPAAGLILNIVFVLALATTLVGAVLAVVTTRIIRSVCGLAICCVGLAELYYFLHSPFLALMEILIYVGAVCVTIVFAVMLAEPEEAVVEKKRGVDFAWSGLAMVVCGAIFFGLWRLGSQQDWTALTPRTNDGSIQSIGKALLTTYSLPFEMISLALLVAILGSLAVARTGRDKA